MAIYKIKLCMITNIIPFFFNVESKRQESDSELLIMNDVMLKGQ